MQAKITIYVDRMQKIEESSFQEAGFGIVPEKNRTKNNPLLKDDS